MPNDPVQMLRDFHAWLRTKDMEIAGYVPDRLLGTSVLRPLHDDDLDAVITDFLARDTQGKPS